MNKIGPEKKVDQQPSLSSALQEVGTGVKDLIQSEMHLAKAEIKETANTLGRYSAQGAIFGALLTISVFPLLAFVVVGLGRILGDNYWLSSLIVGLICAAVGGTLTYRAYEKIKAQDLSLHHTRESLDREKDTISGKTEDLKDAVSLSKRRSA